MIFNSQKDIKGSGAPRSDSPVTLLANQVWRPDVTRHLVHGLCAILIYGVLAFGAVEEGPILILEIGAVALLLIWVVQQLVSGRVRISSNPLYVPVLLFASVVAIQLATKRSIYEYVTRKEALLYAAYAVLLFIASECLSTERRRAIFCVTMGLFGSFYSLFAIIQDLSSNGKLYWLRKPRGSGWIYGSYVNHNHFAGATEMMLPFALILLVMRQFSLTTKFLSGFAAFIMASSIFLSGSRGGMFSCVVQIAFFAIIIYENRGRKWIPYTFLAGSLVLLAFVLIVEKNQITSRITDLSPGVRWQITRDSAVMLKNRPWFGFGLGTFPIAYPRHRSFYTDAFVNEAHNDYAQTFVETGAGGGLVMIAFVVAVIYKGLRAARRVQENWRYASSTAALVGCTGIFVHSLVDFNLQIPANAALFFVLCGIASADLNP